MRVVIGSAFRNSAGRQITRWMDQVCAARSYFKSDIVRAIAVEGDSTDGTRRQLVSAAANKGLQLDLRTYNHGGPTYGSVESDSRMAALSMVGNEILRGVTPADDILIYVESDLIWDPRTISKLIGHVRRGVCDVVAPLIFAGDHFYDVWAFRKDGARFSPFPPYHSGLDPYNLTDVDSAGSCLVMTGLAARTVRMSRGALVEWCNNARGLGFTIKVDPTSRITHPA